MVEKIYKKFIYALARVAVKYIDYKKKRQQNKSVNYINSTKSESDIEYNKKAIADNIPVEDISSVTNINDIDDSIFLGQKNDIDIIDLGKDTEQDEAEPKPMTNEDRLDMLLSQMMPPTDSAIKVNSTNADNTTEMADSVDTANPAEEIDSVDVVDPTETVDSIEAAGQKSANEYADTYEQEDVLKFDESTEVSDKLHNINNDEYTDLETKIVEKA